MKVKITLKKSLIGRVPAHIVTANSLGLHKVGDANVLENNDGVQGKIKQISYLIDVAEAE